MPLSLPPVSGCVDSSQQSSVFGGGGIQTVAGNFCHPASGQPQVFLWNMWLFWSEGGYAMGVAVDSFWSWGLNIGPLHMLPAAGAALDP